MLPPPSLSRVVDNKLAPPPPIPIGVTPTSPHFTGNASANVPVEVLAKWAETVAMMISNPVSPETSAALTALGDHLSVNHWIEAAHAWYGPTPIYSHYGPLCAFSATCYPPRPLCSVALDPLQLGSSSWGLLAQLSPQPSARIQTL